MGSSSSAVRAAVKQAHTSTPRHRELKRPKGHKVQLALGREIDQLQSTIERERKSTSKALSRVTELENQLLVLGAHRDGWQSRSEAHGRFMELLEERLGLSAHRRSWEERREQVGASLAQLLSLLASTDAPQES